MRLRLIAAALLLSACQLALPGKAPEIPPANPITAGPISVTALADPPAAEPALPAESAPPMAGPPAPAQSGAGPETVAAPTPAAPLSPPKSAAQLACEKGGGAWVMAGNTGTMLCQRPQRDGGKQCRRDSDCTGQCLARSRTCAPVAPLFGCNEVLQDNGQRVTLCIE